MLEDLRHYQPGSDYEEVRHRLFAFEGHGGNLYWQMIRALLAEGEVEFGGRERQGATGLVNSLLNAMGAVSTRASRLAAVRAQSGH